MKNEELPIVVPHLMAEPIPVIIKQMNKLYLLGLLIIFGCATTKYFKKEYSKSVNLKEFNQFVHDFEKNYIYLENKKHLWKCIKENYRKEVENITNTKEHVLFYENLINEFYDSHIFVDINASQSYRLNAPFYVINKNGKTYIKNIWQTQIENSNLTNLIGSEILTFNDIDFQIKIAEFPTKCQDKNDKEIREWIANKIIAGRLNENRILKLRLRNGEMLELDIDNLQIREESSMLSYSIISNKMIGIIRINNTLSDKSLVNEFEQAINHMDSTKGLILDLRNTSSGGNTSVAQPIMEMFTDKKQPYQIYENSKRKYFGYINESKVKYDKPVYVLVNRWTGSMGEGIAIGLNTISGIEVVGTEMRRLAGGVKVIDFQNHKYGFKVSYEKIYDINGNPREEFVPNNYVEQTRVDKDEILDYAIELIKTTGNIR